MLLTGGESEFKLSARGLCSPRNFCVYGGLKVGFFNESAEEDCFGLDFVVAKKRANF
jgi:hypothetical protein